MCHPSNAFKGDNRISYCPNQALSIFRDVCVEQPRRYRSCTPYWMAATTISAVFMTSLLIFRQLGVSHQYKTMSEKATHWHSIHIPINYVLINAWRRTNYVQYVPNSKADVLLACVVINPDIDQTFRISRQLRSQQNSRYKRHVQQWHTTATALNNICKYLKIKFWKNTTGTRATQEKWKMPQVWRSESSVPQTIF